MAVDSIVVLNAIALGIGVMQALTERVKPGGRGKTFRFQARVSLLLWLWPIQHWRHLSKTPGLQRDFSMNPIAFMEHTAAAIIMSDDPTTAIECRLCNRINAVPKTLDTLGLRVTGCLFEHSHHSQILVITMSLVGAASIPDVQHLPSPPGSINCQPASTLSVRKA